MDNQIWLEQQPWLAMQGMQVGVDEVGRGPIIGDVVAAAVILPKDCDLSLNDSKKLSETKRDLLAEEIKKIALDYAIVAIPPSKIDEINILQATMLAMKNAVLSLKMPFQQVWVDGNRCPDLSELACNCTPVIKGDGLIAEISAASILAKVYRDQQMYQLDEQFPQYGFAQHKGYPTVKHLAAIEEYGLIDGYRKSFKPVKNLLERENK